MGIFDKFNVGASFGSRANAHNHDHNHGGQEHRHHDGGMGYYAIIEKGGLFYSGEIPGISFSRVSLCNSYDELINKLTKTLNDEMWKKPPMMSYRDVAEKNHGKEIVQIHPTRV